MGDSAEETTRTNAGLRRLGITYCFRFGTGLVLIIIGAIASGYRKGMASNGTPYFLGAFLTGIAMSILGVVNFRYWRNIIRGKASLSQKTQCLRIEIVICAISIVCGISGIIIASVNGVQTPECQSLFGSCSKNIYQQSNAYKFAVAILVLLIFSIFMNIFYIWMHWNTFKHDDISLCSCVKLNNSQNRRQPTPTQRNVTNHAGPVVINYRHGQPEPFGGAILSHPSTSNNQTMHRIGGSGSTGVVLSTRHGQPEPFGGVVLSQPSTNNNQTMHHVGGSGSTGVVLSHPTTPNDNMAVQGNNNLVSELHEQNRLLREQLTIQRRQFEQQEQQQHQNQTVPSAPLIESPPSYESCLENVTKK